MFSTIIPFPLRTISSLSVCFFIGFMSPVISQVATEPIYGPYSSDEGETIIVRTKIHFVNTSTNLWTDTVDLDARATGIMDNLNSVFLPHRISFAITAEGCNDNSTLPPNIVSCNSAEPFYAIDQFDDNQPPASLHCPFVLDIFDQGDYGNFAGSSFGVPATHVRVIGSHNGMPTGHSPAMIQIVGYALGLLRTANFNGGADDPPYIWDNDGCPNTTCQVQEPWPPPYIFCCEDGVSDTEKTPSGLLVQPDCSTCINFPEVSEEQFRNYMASPDGSNPNETFLCKDRFTPGQVERMRAYLQQSKILSDIALLATVETGELPSGIYGNIVVETGTELEINAPIEMLPASTITVEQGGLLRVRSTITGACDRMWRGIVVEGNGFLSQTSTNQGRLVLHSSGTIEHAEVGIEVQHIGSDGMPDPGTGGGIVRVLGGSLVNNTIGVRFGSYFQSTSASRFFSTNFLLDDDYRGGEEQFVFVIMNGVIKQRFLLPSFRDLRTDCTSPRAIGVISKSAGALFQGGEFENLEIGIWIDRIVIGAGSFSITGANFNSCYTGILIKEGSSFKVLDNDFLLKKPDACLSFLTRVVGVQVYGETTGFTFSGNNFIGGVLPSDTLSQEALIGTSCSNLGGGMGHVIKQNTYENLTVGIEVSGNNGGADDGLLFLCNTFISDSTNVDLGLWDFWLSPNATVKQVQAEEIFGAAPLPAGNVFSEYTHNFFNYNNTAIIDYYYEEADTSQHPFGGIHGDMASEGIIAFPVNQPNDVCGNPAPPCPYPPCDEETLMKWKNDFYEYKSRWKEKNALLASGIFSKRENETLKKEIRLLRLAMNRNASLVLQQYSLDTVGMETDTLLHWLTISETYPAHLELASHYFFTGDFRKFDTLWPLLSTKYRLSGTALTDHIALSEIYGLVRPHLAATGTISGLDENTLQSLTYWDNWCSEPGFLTHSILLRNGVLAKPDCSNDIVQNYDGNKKEKTDIAEVVEQVFRVFPNPASSEVHVDWRLPCIGVELQLYDLTGIPILHQKVAKKTSTTSFSVSDLPIGIYFLEMKKEGQSLWREKIMVLR